MLEKFADVPMAIWLPAIGILVVAASILVIIAFRQGREISFWPPRIGPKIITQQSLRDANSDGPPLQVESPRIRRLWASSFDFAKPDAVRDVDWVGLQLRLDSLVLLHLMSRTDHSTIHTCQIPAVGDEIFIVKRTSAEMGDFDALVHLVTQAKFQLPSAVEMPVAVWEEDAYIFELQRFVAGTDDWATEYVRRSIGRKRRDSPCAIDVDAAGSQLAAND